MSITDTGSATGMAEHAGTGATSQEESRLLRAASKYMPAEDQQHVRTVFAYARALRAAQRKRTHVTQTDDSGRDAGYVLSVARTLVESVHIDAISLAAVLLYQFVESDQATLDDIRARLGETFGEQVAQTIYSIERFDTLQRPGADLRRNALVDTAASERDTSRERRRGRDRQRQLDKENIRKMFVAMAEDPHVAIFKVADFLRTMRAASEIFEHLEQSTSSTSDMEVESGTARTWTAEECRVLAHEAREIYAPLAGRLGMGRVESELEDLAFAVLEPEDYHWLSAAVAEYAQERGSYIERVTNVLRREMHSIGLRAEISGRVKHLYSIYRKLQRTGSRDLASLYDILAFRILVDTIPDCYLALGHVHALWRPKDGRIKDYIANPKPNGYQSLHTTVFCLDDRLAEIQIRTHEMHERAEYGLATHWYYKSAGDGATADAGTLQGWMAQVKEWQQELQASRSGNTNRVAEAVGSETLKEQIFVFTPAGDVKDMPAGSTPIDFAYRVHTDVGNHVAGVRVSSTDSTGRLVKKLVPLDYELKNGDVVEIIKRKDAHPTRDWLHIAQTKLARDRIHRFMKEHERDIDLQMGRDRLDRELKTLGLRKGYDDLSEEDILWLVAALDQSSEDALLTAIGSDKIRVSTVLTKVRERLRPVAQTEVATEQPVTTTPREAETSVNVEGMAGMLTRLANCCNPLPGDRLKGFITRGRGVVIHRADCSNLIHLLQRQPERGVDVDWPRLDGSQVFRAPIVIEASDRTGLLADVTGLITNMKINMLKVQTVTKPAQHRAIITATLEIQRPEQLNAVIKELQQIASVQTVERKKPHHAEESRRAH